MQRRGTGATGTGEYPVSVFAARPRPRRADPPRSPLGKGGSTEGRLTGGENALRGRMDGHRADSVVVDQGDPPRSPSRGGRAEAARFAAERRRSKRQPRVRQPRERRRLERQPRRRVAYRPPRGGTVLRTEAVAAIAHESSAGAFPGRRACLPFDLPSRRGSRRASARTPSLRSGTARPP